MKNKCGLHKRECHPPFYVRVSLLFFLLLFSLSGRKWTFDCGHFGVPYPTFFFFEDWSAIFIFIFFVIANINIRLCDKVERIGIAGADALFSFSLRPKGNKRERKKQTNRFKESLKAIIFCFFPPFSPKIHRRKCTQSAKDGARLTVSPFFCSVCYLFSPKKYMAAREWFDAFC